MVVRIPPKFDAAPFTVADALAAGLSKKVLHGPRFRAPYRGVRVPAGLPDTQETDCHALALLLDGEWAFSHATGAVWCELPLPAWLRTRKPLHVAVGAKTPVPQIEGVTGHEGLDIGRIVRRDGLPVVHPSRTWCDLVPVLSDWEAVILGDAVLRRWAKPHRLAQAIAGRAGERGVVRMRRLAPLLRERVDSPQETRTRLLLHAARLPEPVCGYKIFADDGGGLLHIADLCWPQAKVIVEYDGEVHRQNRQKWRNDIARKELLQEHGWHLVIVTADDLSHRQQMLVARVSKALRHRDLRW
jgi:hypothetical protein